MMILSVFEIIIAVILMQHAEETPLIDLAKSLHNPDRGQSLLIFFNEKTES